MIGWNPWRILRMSTVGLLLVSHPAYATIYSWTGEGGVRMLTNDPADVPADQQTSAQMFTAKPAPSSVSREEATPSSSGDPYQRGFDAGLQVAERQVALAGELARSILAAVPQTPPAPIVIEQSAPPAPDLVPDYAPPYYGYAPPYYALAAPYAPYAFPSAFAISFVPDRHFFGGGRGRFFPHRQFWQARTGRMMRRP